jgi:anti-sigma-K factor RskA
MSERPIIGDEPLDDATLAGEYVLGLLPETERRAVERRMASDLPFAALVDGWANRLQPLADAVPAVAPPARVWSAVGAATGGARAGESFWQSLAFWRWTTVISSAAAVAGFLVVVSLSQELRQGAFVASLQAPTQGPTFLARLDAAGRLVILPQAMQASAATVPELWVIPPDGRPRSLGVIAPARESEIRVPQPLAPFLVAEATLAVSLEPQGGSPTGQPTGPVIATGKLQKI